VRLRPEISMYKQERANSSSSDGSNVYLASLVIYKHLHYISRVLEMPSNIICATLANNKLLKVVEFLKVKC
jgi:hypothetical protein